MLAMEVDNENKEGKNTNFGPPTISFAELNLKRKIGAGAYGEVYLGTCRSTECAIKLLFPYEMLKLKKQAITEEKFIRDFKNEVLVASLLNHKNVVSIMGCSIDGDRLAIVMEICPGSLENVLDPSSEVELSLFRKLQIAAEIAEGMNWLHTLKPPIMHRDLKPPNILFDQHGRVKISDFGLSHLKLAATDRENSGKGTPLYMAPEALMGSSEVGLPVDVYAFAIMFWEILTKESPFSHHSRLADFKISVCRNHERPPIPDNLIKPVKDLLERCWAHDPAHRPTFAQISEELQRLVVFVAIPDQVGFEFWLSNFGFADVVPFEAFINSFNSSFGAPKADGSIDPLQLQQIALLKLVFGVTRNPMDGKEEVSLEKFGYIVSYFGPLVLNSNSKKNFISQIFAICPRRYFFGYLSAMEAKGKCLRSSAGSYMLRFSSIPGNFTLDFSYIDKSLDSVRVAQRRISLNPQTNVYFFNHRDPNTNENYLIQSAEGQSLHSFIRSLKQHPLFLLSRPVETSPFAAAYQIAQRKEFMPNSYDEGYLNDW